MNRPFGLAALAGVALGALAAVIWQRSHERDSSSNGRLYGANGSGSRHRNLSGSVGSSGVSDHVERVTAGDGGLPPTAAVSGRPDAEEHDPLHGSAHELSPDQAEHVRAANRLIRGGKATSSEREKMYEESDKATVSGSMSDTLGREDHNPIGRRSG